VVQAVAATMVVLEEQVLRVKETQVVMVLLLNQGQEAVVAVLVALALRVQHQAVVMVDQVLHQVLMEPQ
tara:strand:+ start:319 stop:525 length:207 start_codon:yes stop_codon:yes gene_type:complete